MADLDKRSGKCEGLLLGNDESVRVPSALSSQFSIRAGHHPPRQANREVKIVHIGRVACHSP